MHLNKSLFAFNRHPFLQMYIVVLAFYVGLISAINPSVAEEGLFVQPIATYSLYGGNISASSASEIRQMVQSESSANFDKCTALPTYSCSNFTYTSITPTPGFATINGIPTMQHLNRTVVVVSKTTPQGPAITTDQGVVGGLGIAVALRCPEPYGGITTGAFPNFTLQCQYSPKYKAVLPREIPPLTCGVGSAPKTVANPIEVATGGKFQPERFDFEGLKIDFSFRSHGAQAGTTQFQHQPDQIRKGQQLIAADNSIFYSTKILACLQGFIEIQNRASANSWLRSVTAEYSCETCLLRKGGQVVSSLAIVEGAGLSASVEEADVVQLQEANGTVSNFYKGCTPNQYKSFSPDINSTIETDDAGNMQISKSNSRKIFSAAGQLFKVVSSKGRDQQYLEYDESGNLKIVKKWGGA